MTALIAIPAALAYVTAGLFAARWLYGHWRARSIDKNKNQETRYPPTTAEAVKNWNEIERGPAMVAALACGLLWPVTAIAAPLIVLLARFMSATPVLSEAERKDQRVQRERRITELETENDRLRRQQVIP